MIAVAAGTARPRARSSSPTAFGHPPTPRGTSAGVERRSPADPAAPRSPLPTSIEFPPGAFAIELAPGEDAPSIEAPMTRPSSDPVMGLRTLASSGVYAISGGEHLFLLTSRDEGVLGSIPALSRVKPAWVGILGSGALLAASSTD